MLGYRRLTVLPLFHASLPTFPGVGSHPALTAPSTGSLGGYPALPQQVHSQIPLTDSTLGLHAVMMCHPETNGHFLGGFKITHVLLGLMPSSLPHGYMFIYHLYNQQLKEIYRMSVKYSGECREIEGVVFTLKKLPF